MIFESIKVMKLKTDFSKRLIWQETSIWQETIERRQPRAKYNFELLFFCNNGHEGAVGDT